MTQRFVYDVTDNSGGTPRHTTMVMDVADPYVARIVNRAGPPPGGAVQGGSAWGRSGLLLLSADGSARQVQQAPPGFTGGDSRLDVALPLADKLHWVVPQNRTSNSGGAVSRPPCTHWESGPPLDSGTIAPPTHDEHTDSCVDASGRIVSDTWTRHNVVLRTRQLVSTGAGPRLTLDGLEAGATPAPLPSGTATQLTRPVEATKLARLMGMTLPVPPPGLRLDRATALAVTTPDGTAQREGASFTYVRPGSRSDLLVLTVTRYLVGAARPPDSGLVLRLPAATGRLLPVLAGTRAEYVTRTGLAVTVDSDLPVAALRPWLTHLAIP